MCFLDAWMSSTYIPKLDVKNDENLENVEGGRSIMTQTDNAGKFSNGPYGSTPMGPALKGVAPFGPTKKETWSC